MKDQVIVDLHNVSMLYQSVEAETEAIHNISFQVYNGEFIAIVGPSGCGKTTILSMIAGLLKPSSGDIYVLDKKVDGPSSSIGYMLQHDYLFEWRTIEQNVRLGLEIKKKLDQNSIAKVNKMLDMYGLAEFKNHYPNQLSGGMRQKVALIRTLAVNPDILLLDEPFSALDYQTRLAISDEVWTIIKKENKTALLVTHDISEAISMADRVIVLSKRPASIKKIYNIKLTCNVNSPINCRKAPEFMEYFDKIWKELEVHVD